MVDNWLNHIVNGAKRSYNELFGEEPQFEVRLIETNSWEKELETRGVTPRKHPAVYLVNEILLREDATYFDVLHEFGHEALYRNMGVKEEIAELKKMGGGKKLKQLEDKLPLKFLENAANQYAKVIGSRMKYHLPEIISNAVKELDPKFAAFNGSVQRTGWGNDMDIWIIVDDPEKLENIKFPKEWDIEVVSTKVFEEGVENADGIYIDLAACGSVLVDECGYANGLKAHLGAEPTAEEADYHFKRSYRVWALAKRNLAELERYAHEKLLGDIPAREAILMEVYLPSQYLFYNPLSYSVSYAHIGKEYSNGNRILISKEQIPLLAYIRGVKNIGYTPYPEKLVKTTWKFLEDALCK